jgi:topoisomerase-4 subunit B
MPPRAACTASAYRWSMRLSTDTVVEVARNKELLPPAFSRGPCRRADLKAGPHPQPARHHRCFTPDPEIFGADAKFKPARLFRLAGPRPICSRASKSAGNAIRNWPAMTRRRSGVPVPGGLADHLTEQLGTRECVTSDFFHGIAGFPGRSGPRRMGGRLAAVVGRAAIAGTATPSPPPMAAPTKRACAPR